MSNRRDFLKAAVALPLVAGGSSAVKKPSANRYARPLVVSTWDSGMTANAAAWKLLKEKKKAIDAVEAGSRASEDEPSCCVGLAAYPDRDGYVTLDASIMDHRSNCGSVVYLQQIQHPISVARKVMESTKHVLLAGDGALQFALENGFEKMPGKLSADAEKQWKEWLKKSDYKPIINIENRRISKNDQTSPYTLNDGARNHDTMGTIALDTDGDLSGSCTTSGMAFKMHGRVGDSPIIGAGLFVDNEIGAAVSSGVGEEVIRICGTHLIIELMRFRYSPENACKEAIRRIVERDKVKAKEMQVGFIAISKNGDVGAYAIQRGFTYSVTNSSTNKVFESPSYFKDLPPAS